MLLSGEARVTGDGCGAEAALHHLFQAETGARRSVDHVAEGPMVEDHRRVSGRLTARTGSEILAPSPQDLAVAQVDHRSGPVGGIGRMVHDQGEHPTGTEYARYLGEEPGYLGEVLDNEYTDDSGDAAIAHPTEIGQPASDHRTVPGRATQQHI